MECVVENGSIHYESYGEGSPILILHAMGTDYRSMTAWMEPIFQDLTGWRRIYIDVPAHGESKINENVLSTEDMLNSLLEFIDKTIPNQSFSLVGASFGGYLAQGIMHYKQNVVNGMCLIAPAIHVKERKVPEKVVIEKDHELLKELEPDIRTAFETLMIYQNKASFEQFFLTEIQPGRLLANREFLASDWRKDGYFLQEEPFWNVDKLTQPVLFVLGRQDSFCGYEDYFSLLEKFPYASCTILDRAGHLIPIDKRELVQELVKDWLVRVRTA